MYLEEITNTVQLESDKFECKRQLNRDDVVGWLKSIAGFANASGGEFYIGVVDGTNELMGFDRKGADKERNFFNNKINEHLTPRPQVHIEFLRYEIREKERFVIKAVVEESSVKPVILKYNQFPLIYMKREGYTSPATYEEIIEMSVKSNRLQYDNLVSDIKYDPQNFRDLQEFYKDHNDGKEIKEKALYSIGFMNKDGYLKNGAILFADDYKGEKTNVKCSVFSGFNKGSRKITTINEFTGNIIETIRYMLEFVNQRMNHAIIKLDNSRINVDSYPQRALFEGIINAVAHRDYYLDGTQIQIDIFRDRIEISSPGAFYMGEKFDKTYDLSGVISKRRNELITEILVSCNVMEAAGTGFDKIIEDYATADEKHRPYIYSTSDHFTLVLPDLTYENGIEVDELPVVSFMPVKNGTRYDKKVLEFCYHKAHKVSEIAEYLQVSNSSYLRNEVLGNLEANNLLKKSKVANAACFKTNHKLVSIE